MNEPSCAAGVMELLEQSVVHVVGGPAKHREWGGRFQIEKESRGGLDVKCDRGLYR